MSRPPLSPSASRRMRGFEPAAGLVKEPIRHAGERRGFAVARLLTHWADVVGEEMAAVTRPVKMGYGREGFGGTLTLLVASAHAPMVQLSLPRLKDRVNALYGYNAVSRIVLTQTAPTGFAEGQAQFTPAPVAPKETPADPVIAAIAALTAEGITDPALRAALEGLARNILTRRKAEEGKTE